jgi:hypothetical protein
MCVTPFYTNCDTVSFSLYIDRSYEDEDDYLIQIYHSSEHGAAPSRSITAGKSGGHKIIGGGGMCSLTRTEIKLVAALLERLKLMKDDRVDIPELGLYWYE